MPTVEISCPWCSKLIQGAFAAAARVQCPRCHKAFALRPEDLRAAETPARPAHPPAARGRPISGPALFGLGAAFAGGMLFVGTAILAVVLAGRRPPQVAAAPPAPVPADTSPAPDPEEVVPPADPPREPVRDDPLPAEPPLIDAPPDLAPPAPELAALPPELQDKVNGAIDRGVAFLLKAQNADGSWTSSENVVDGFPAGLTALCGLTLLECGLPAADAHVNNAADFVRRKAPRLEKTYELSLAILFLDRLGEPGDEPTLRSLALRLSAGQTALGGWSYDCPLLGPDAEAETLAGLEKERATAAADVENGPFDRDAFDAADNSNTQFAILGLWTARRHGFPTERALALVNRRFRASQADDGHWGYYLAETRNKEKGPLSTPSMTAAGLLGLAVGRAADADRPAGPDGDAAIDRGMRALGDSIGGGRKLGSLLLPPAFGLVGALNPARDGGARISPDAMGKALDLYFLWSVERVGVLFNQGTIGGKEWYPWGARLLVDGQNDGGGWGKGGAYFSSPTVDTCFGLLFLKRANLASDLTARLDYLARVKPKVAAPPPGRVIKKDAGP